MHIDFDIINTGKGNNMEEREKQVDNLLDKVDKKKRAFLKKILFTTAFIAPHFVSFRMKKFRIGPPPASAS